MRCISWAQTNLKWEHVHWEHVNVRTCILRTCKCENMYVWEHVYVSVFNEHVCVCLQWTCICVCLQCTFGDGPLHAMYLTHSNAQKAMYLTRSNESVAMYLMISKGYVSHEFKRISWVQTDLCWRAWSVWQILHICMYVCVLFNLVYVPEQAHVISKVTNIHMTVCICVV